MQKCMTCDALPVYSVALLSSQASHRRILTRVLVGIFKTGITQLCTPLSSQASHRCSDSCPGWDCQDQSHSIETPSPSTDLMSLRQNLLLCRRSQCLHSAYRRDLADRDRWGGISFCMASATSSVRLFSVNSISYKRIRRLRRCVCLV
jgi:hypothetical protein